MIQIKALVGSHLLPTGRHPTENCYKEEKEKCTPKTYQPLYSSSTPASENVFGYVVEIKLGVEPSYRKTVFVLPLKIGLWNGLKIRVHFPSLMVTHEHGKRKQGRVDRIVIASYKLFRM